MDMNIEEADKQPATSRTQAGGKGGAKDTIDTNTTNLGNLTQGNLAKSQIGRKRAQSAAPRNDTSEMTETLQLKLMNPAAGRVVKKVKRHDDESDARSHRSKRTSKSRRSAFTSSSKKGDDFASMTIQDINVRIMEKEKEMSINNTEMKKAQRNNNNKERSEKI